MKSGDLSIDTFFSMSPHALQTETNKKKKKENMLQAMEDAIITEEMTRVCDVYVMGQMEWRGQQKQKMSYAKPENVEKI